MGSATGVVDVERTRSDQAERASHVPAATSTSMTTPQTA